MSSLVENQDKRDDLTTSGRNIMSNGDSFMRTYYLCMDIPARLKHFRVRGQLVHRPSNSYPKLSEKWRIASGTVAGNGCGKTRVL